MESIETIDELIRLGPEFALKFVVAVLCGGALGMERETTGKPAGLRTSILVCLGSMLFTEASIKMGAMYGGDGTRIAAQIVTGIGFLGAGVILHEKRGGIKGVTTAALIWLMAGLGTMIGAGFLISSMAITAATVLIILVLRKVENSIHKHHGRVYSFHIDDSVESRERVTALLAFYEDGVENFTMDEDAGQENDIVVSFRFIGTNSERRDLLEALYQLKGLRKLTTGNKPVGPQERRSPGGITQGVEHRSPR